MALPQDMGLKTTYDKCKYKVKQWENIFKKTNGRPPSKLDIREASREVRHSYKTYFKLKTAALEESLTNIEGFDIAVEKSEEQAQVNDPIKDLEQNNALDKNVQLSSKTISEDTWGAHLNKITKNTNDKTKNEKSTVNLSFTHKLFQASKTSKRLPRKSLSFNRKKSDLDSSKSQFFSQPDRLLPSSQDADCLPSMIINNDFEDNNNIKTVVSKPVVFSQPINIVQNTFSRSYNDKPLRVVDDGWLGRLAEDTTSNIISDITNRQLDDINYNATQVTYDSDDVIDNSDNDDYENSCSLYHIAKKRRVIGTPVNETKQESETSSRNNLVTVDILTKRLDFSNIFKNKPNKHEETTDNSKLSDANNFTPQETDNTSKVDEPQLHNTTKNLRKFERLRKTTYTHQPDTQNEDPFHSDDDDKDKDFVVENEPEINVSPVGVIEHMNVAKPRPGTRKQKVNKKNITNEAKSSTQDSYELEYSVKPRIVTVPRIKNIKRAIRKNNRQTHILAKEKTETTTGIVDKPVQKEEQKLQQKIESGTLNDNYVQINLKKKIFVRGHKKKSFSRYKKQMWKNKKKSLCGPDMDMGGCDGGTLTCFNCGQSGHFARACKLSKGDGLRPLEEDREECPYPTLEEAAQMAKGSVLSIRKPNADHFCKTNEQETANETEKDTDSDLDPLFDDEFNEVLGAEVDRLEQIAKIDARKYVDVSAYVKPYYNPREDGSVIGTPQEVFDALQLFGHQAFRSGQEQTIMRILSGKSTLVTLSTGSGKSLCYQLPAYLYSKREPCISLIISPLVSLMEDQVTGIPMFLKAACLHTNQTKPQREKVMDAIKMGNLNVLLVSPEAVVAGEKSSGFGSILRQLPPIAFACIDEAHCVSHWSHNFRPSYLKICKVLKDRLGVRTILGLTATATRATCDSIIDHLSILDGQDGVISDIPLPNNLRLTVSRDEQRDQALLGLLLSEPFSSCKSIIVYCTRREECQRVATFLRTCLKNEVSDKANNKKRKRYSLQAEHYHAGMPAGRRRSIQKAFMSGELRIVVATVAFGMGINKSDIRAVIHYNMPMSFESYVQEVGRAGRDGLPAHCHLFLDAQGKDENELQRHIYANSTDRHVIRKLLQRCFIPCSCKSACPRHEVSFSIEETVRALDIPEENIETLLCYLELHDKRHIELLSHAYVTCKIISYGGTNEISKASKECAPLAMALALHKKDKNGPDNIFEFPVVEIASAIGWDSGISKHILKNLEWTNENNQPKRSKLNVQFMNLGFRLLSPGNLPEAELDETLDNLYKRVKDQEEMSLLQLQAVHATLSSVAFRSYKLCLQEYENTDKDVLLKTKIREYFESSKLLEILPDVNTQPINEEVIKSDVCSLVCMYRDNSFTGRAVARIFHGIQSPNYLAVIWGRCKFWRAHLGVDFNAICQIATKEILRLR